MADRTKYERQRGTNEPPVERRTVRAGPLEAELEGPDLRYLRIGGVEVARRLYVAVRDRHWGTLPPQLRDVRLRSEDGAFELRFEARHSDPALGVAFGWRGELVGAGDGTLTLTFDGMAESDMEYNRIGWCVLHPAENAGRRYRAWRRGSPTDGVLPVAIGPQLIIDGSPAALFGEFDRLDVEVSDGLWARFEFEGAAFEMEDQRNWSDASFKTYSVPTQERLPHTAARGDRIRQSVRISMEGTTPPRRESAAPPSVRLLAPCGPLPAIGVGAASDDRPPTPRAGDLLRAARFAHLRADVDTAAPAWRERLHRACDEARLLGTALELAVFVSEEAGDVDVLAAALREEGVAVARVLAFREDEPVSTADTIERVRAGLRALPARVPIVGGTNLFFTDINRQRDEAAAGDGVAWPLSATVHASDDTSVMETATTHGQTVSSARAFAPGRTLHVTPITFKPQFNPAAAEPGTRELPPQVDVRQPSLLAGAWTVTSLRQLAESGASSLTYFETTGWRGLLEGPDGPALPERFRSWPEMVFPVYHVLADAGEWAGGEVVATATTEPFALEALAVRDTGGVLHVLVASCAAEPQHCRIEGLPTGEGTLRVLDEDSFTLAASEAERFRAGFRPVSVDSVLELELAPYAVVRLDVPA